jgi:predicted dehydrogenase
MSSAGRPLRIGIAGIGFGAAVHLPALRACPGVEVAALCASTQARAAAAASRLGVPVGVGDVDSLLALDLEIGRAHV